MQANALDAERIAARAFHDSIAVIAAARDALQQAVEEQRCRSGDWHEAKHYCRAIGVSL